MRELPKVGQIIVIGYPQYQYWVDGVRPWREGWCRTDLTSIRSLDIHYRDHPLQHPITVRDPTDEEIAARAAHVLMKGTST